MSLGSVAAAVICIGAFIAQLPSNSKNLLPDGVCNSAEGIGYFRSEQNSIIAIRLATGKVLWESSDAAVPLIAKENALIAADFRYWRTGQFEVAVLNAETGVLKIRSQPIAIGQSPKSTADSFPALDAISEGTSFRILWETISPSIGGAPPPTQNANKAPKRVIHTVVLNSTDGRVEERPLQVETVRTANIPTNSVAYRRRGAWEKGPWEMDRDLINLVSPGGSIASQTELQSVDRRSKQRKHSGPLHPGTPYVSSNGLHVLVMSGEPKAEKSTIYRSTDGHEVAKISLDEAPEDWAIVGSQLLYTSNVQLSKRTVERVLKSVSLTSGQQIWSYHFGEKRLTAPPPLPQ